jgi:hypothetical protein
MSNTNLGLRFAGTTLENAQPDLVYHGHPGCGGQGFFQAAASSVGHRACGAAAGKRLRIQHRE